MHVLIISSFFLINHEACNVSQRNKAKDVFHQHVAIEYTIKHFNKAIICEYNPRAYFFSHENACAMRKLRIIYHYVISAIFWKDVNKSFSCILGSYVSLQFKQSFVVYNEYRELCSCFISAYIEGKYNDQMIIDETPYC